MTPLRPTPLMRHGTAWIADRWYRRAWLAWPQLGGLLIVGWLFGIPHPPPPPTTPGTWIHPTHGRDENVALKALRDGAVTDPKALAELQGRADSGNSLAQFYMGTLTDPKLKYLPPDYAKAVAWYRKASDAGSDAAAGNLGLLLLVSQQFGVPTDYDAARKLFERAAPTTPVARRELGLMKLRGWGEPADPIGGMPLIRDAAEHGDAFSQRLVGEAFDKGQNGLAVDPHEAVLWLQKAAAQNDGVAQHRLGLHLKTGNGVPEDQDAATAWFRKAVANGDATAQAELAGETSGAGGVTPR